MSAVLERMVIPARCLDATQLDAALLDAHRRTASILADLDGCESAIASGWQVPMLAIVNPPLWESGHVAWFAEWWILRDPRPVRGAGPMEPWVATRASLLDDADRWFDSSRVAHDTRWSLSLPSIAGVKAYVDEVLDRVRARLAVEPDADDDEALYPYRLALFHEDMHGEALIGLRQTLDYPAPPTIDATPTAIDGDVRLAIDGGRFHRGIARDQGFAFDNEQDASTIDLARFTIDAACVSNAAFRDFVEAGGYRDTTLWPGEAGRWLASHRADHPVRWRRRDRTWEQRWFGAWQPLPLSAPVCHVNAFEAEAYCLWAGRRLPRESEWECAATGSSGDRFRWGEAVWEWTADAFEPYAGFVPGRYREYSVPWFGTHRAVRGASFATHARMRHPRYRNFYTPERNDLFIGFRTCAR